MNQDRANVIPKPLPVFLRVVCIALAILCVLGSALNFGTAPSPAADLPFAIATVLFVSVPLAAAFILWPIQTAQLTGAFSLGLLGFSVVWVSSLIDVMAIFFPLLSLPVIVIAWLGVAMLAISELLFVGVLGSTVLTRLRAST
jgi:hypothetical protein